MLDKQLNECYNNHEMRKIGGGTVLNICKMRKDRNISQTELAKAIGVKNNTLCQYETGKRMPNIIVLTNIAKVLNCSVDELIKNKEV